MYDSGEQRAAEIDKGARLDAPTLRTWATASASTLEAQVVDFPPERWAAKVVTARGRTVPVSQVLWLRTREVAVHAIDLCAGVEFRDLPHDLCRALVGDIAAHRSGGTGPSLVLTAPDATSRWVIKGVGAPRYVELPVADLAAWLSGREVLPDFPQLSAWL